MTGIMYAVGVGPGDPELITVKALKIIDNCQYLVVPCSDKNKSVAYRIVEAICDLETKEIVEIDMPMTKNVDILNEAHQNGAKKIKNILDQGCDVAFVNLGDPSIYASSMYIANILNQDGYKVNLVSAVPSFVAVASRLNISLAEADEQIHIISDGNDIDQALKNSGTKIFMKIGKSLKELKSLLKGLDMKVYAVENCGLADERVYVGVENIPDSLSYFSIVIVKDQ